jgi:hypothetical protein
MPYNTRYIAMPYNTRYIAMPYNTRYIAMLYNTRYIAMPYNTRYTLYINLLYFTFIIYCMALQYTYSQFYVCGPSSSVGIATDYGLDSLGIKSQWG